MGPDFSGIATFAIIGFIAIIGAIILGIYTFCDYFWITDKYESKKVVVPEMVIKSETHNGKMHSDTTYIYTFN